MSVHEERRRRLAARHAGPVEFTDEMADAVLAVLQEHGLSATDDYYLESLRLAMTVRGGAEQGLRLGAFSGLKIRTEHTGRGWRVDCYPEERTPDLDARIDAANAALAALERRLIGDPVELMDAILNGGGE